MTDDRSMKYRTFDLEVKAEDIAATGEFTGYGSVYGVVDSYEEIVAKGAFRKSLAEIKKAKRLVPVLWQHQSNAPIGVYPELAEDDYGLKVRGQLLAGEVAQATECLALMRAGAVTGLSIGYIVRKSSYDEKTGIRTLIELDLIEVSLVTFPANAAARIDAVKSKLAHGELPTLPEFEKFLREAGFSKSQATAIAGKGLASLLRGEPGNPTDEPDPEREFWAAMAG